MARRANGEGNIRKHKASGRWLISWPTGLYRDDGKREYVYRYADTQAEAREVLDKLKAEAAMGISQSKATVKTGEWMENWIEKHKAPKLAPATLTSYRNNFRLHIRPYIGNIPLKELSTYKIQRCLDATGIPWRDLPERFGPWQSVYSRFRAWAKAGVWERILSTQIEQDLADETALMLDSTTVKVHQAQKGDITKKPGGAGVV